MISMRSHQSSLDAIFWNENKIHFIRKVYLDAIRVYVLCYQN